MRQKLSFGFKLLFLTAIYLLWSTTAFGQRSGAAAQGGSVRPEGPMMERASSTVRAVAPGGCDPNMVDGTCPGTYSFVYGFNASARPRHGGNETIKAGFAFTVYFTKRLLVEVDNDNVLSLKPETSARVTGFGDTTVYVGADASLDKPESVGVTFLYGIKAPTASESKGLGSGEVDHTVLGVVAKTVGKSYFEGDFGDYIARTPGNGFDHFPFAAAIWKQKLGSQEKFTFHFEVGGSFKTDNYIGDMYNLDYLETKLSDKVKLRMGGRFGLTSNAPKAGVYVGLKLTGLF